MALANHDFFPMIFRNIVSTVNLDCKLDLKSIALQARNAEYNPKVRILSGKRLHISGWEMS